MTIKQVAHTSWIEFLNKVEHYNTSETMAVRLDLKKVFAYNVSKRVRVDGCFQDGTVAFNAEHNRFFVYSTKSEEEFTESLDVLEKVFKAHA